MWWFVIGVVMFVFPIGAFALAVGQNSILSLCLLGTNEMVHTGYPASGNTVLMHVACLKSAGIIDHIPESDSLKSRPALLLGSL